MDPKHIDEENLRVSGVPSTRDSLIGLGDVTFDGQPAVTLLVRANGKEGLVHLSPFHGDRRKEGFVDIAPGTRCELVCPVSKVPLPKVGAVDDGSGADYYAIYLTPACTEEAMVAISDLWGHYASRIVDDSEVISYWARTHES